MKHLVAALVLIGSSSMATAQEYGLSLGFSQNTAEVDQPAGSNGTMEGKLGFSGGVAVAFELMPGFRFRSGLLYSQRQADFKFPNSKYQLNLSYLDVPIMAQYNVNPMFGLFGGMVVGIKASDSVKNPAGATKLDLDMKAMYPILAFGANFTFDDLIGFDAYVERGLGEYASAPGGYGFKDSTTFGLRFIYWM